MKQRHFIVISAGLLLAALFSVSCQKPFHDPSEHYVLVAQNMNIPYFQEAWAGFTDAAQGLGVKAQFEGSASYGPEETLKALQGVIAQRPTGILVVPPQPHMFTAAINQAVQVGIPVITIDTDEPESKRIMYIGTDNLQAGRESGKQIASLMKGKGKLVVITIPGQFNLEERLQGVQEVLANYPDIKITHTLNSAGDPRVASGLLADLLKRDEAVDGILCLDASSGPGAGDTVHSLHLEDKVVIVAMDTDPATLDYIQHKVIAVTIGQKPYTMAFYALRFLDDLHHNVVHEFTDWRTAPISPLPTRVDTGTSVIDLHNLAGFRAAAINPLPLSQ